MSDRRDRPLRGRLLLAGLVGILALVVACASSDREPVEPSPPARFTDEALREILAPVREQLDANAFPGTGVAVGVRGDEAHYFGFGKLGWTANAAAVDPDSTIYDLASLTKVLATASAIMLLVDEGKLELDAPVSQYLPSFTAGPKAEVTLRHFLTHTSGLPEGAELRAGRTREDKIERAASLPIYPPAGARVGYSDLGFILAWEIAGKAAGEPLTDYLRRKLYEPLGMSSTAFLPGLDCERCAPTGRLRDQSLYRGKPFDPLAQRLEGISGSAGLFSTTRDVGRFAAMIAAGGELDGVRVFSPEAIAEFTGPQPVGGRYRLGWETMCDIAPTEDDDRQCARTIAIGHTGWTGTSIWIDPESGIWTVLLTNRTYESRAPNELQRVRRELFARATGRPGPADSVTSSRSSTTAPTSAAGG